MLLIKKATILIYVLILISIVMVMAVVILNNSVTLQNSLDYQKIQSEISLKIRQKAEVQAKYDLAINNDWSWFIDIMSCPDNITMSWNTLKTTWLTTSWVRLTGKLYVCSWSYNGASFSLFLNPTYTSFDKAFWWFSTVDLTDTWWWNLAWSTRFTSDNTLISFPATSYKKPDWVDDNFNSDNFNSKSIWSSQYNF